MKLGKNVKLIITDVDDTVAPMFCPASDDMIAQLEKLFLDGKVILFISGQSVTNIYERVISKINPKYYSKIIVAHCNGSEIFCLKEDGELVKIYSVFQKYADRDVRFELQDVVNYVMKLFHMKGIYTGSIEEFQKKTSGCANEVMVGDRGVQIALDFVNSIQATDFRLDPIENLQMQDDIREMIVLSAMQYAKEKGYVIQPTIAGVCAVDFVISGVGKDLPIKELIQFGNTFRNDLPEKFIFSDVEELEVWGDSFENNGSDMKMSLALPKEVRSINFRKCNHSVIRSDYNVLNWEGKFQCAEGLLEYLSGK